MSIPKKLVKVIQTLYRQSLKTARGLAKRLMAWLLRKLMVVGRHRPQVGATSSGFILPTVTMVILVVILLTTAIVFRSFDRAKNASNYRVNEAVLKAATPAIDRAKAKLDTLFADPTLPRATPSEEALASVFRQKEGKYTLGDEERLEIDGEGDPVWRFPVDTNNDGKFDSFTYYGIFFKTPSNEQAKARDPEKMEARTPPMDEGRTNKQCTEVLATSASLVGGRGYYKVGAELKKSIFVYTATEPITDLTGLNAQTYQVFPGGNKGFSALEYQQDRARIPLTNNAVVYEDDLQIAPGAGTTFNLNGRIFTNGNLLIGNEAPAANPTINLYLVSSAASCFYQEENSKIVVGGNVGIGPPDATEKSVGARVHKFKEGATVSGALPNGSEILGTGNKSVTNNPQQIASNNLAYAKRLDHLVKNTSGGDPTEVQNRPAGTSREKALENYYKERTRRVPFAEVSQTLQNPTGSGDTLRPVDNWIFPFNLTNNQTSNNSLSLKFNGNFLDPPATEPETQKTAGEEKRLGDRLLVGNALPAKWWNNDTFADEETEQPVLKGANAPVFWNEPDDEPRFRTTQMTPISDLGDTDRNGFWERMAAQQPTQPLEGIGGLRVVTGAGIYVDDDGIAIGTPGFPRNDPTKNSRIYESYLPAPNWDTRFVDPANSDPKRIHVDDLKTQLGGDDPIIVWPDTMPISGGEGDLTGNNGAGTLANSVTSDFEQKGDLLMRASVVYHYGSGAGTNPAQEGGNKNQTPIACVSSFYDPTDAVTAQNNPTVIGDWENPLATAAADFPAGRTGKSNNGIVYNYASVTGIPENQLERQARLVYPDGRLVNEPLWKALNTPAANRLWADYAAIHAARCAVGILRGTATVDNSGTIPHGAIYETTLLDARQLKAIHQQLPQHLTTDPAYDLEIEDRQPLEVRVTVLDLNQLRQTTATASANGSSPEFLLPNSGIIYATRDDALLDLSDNWGNLDPTAIETRKRFSPVDFKLDPTRRPSGIMLRNGTILARQDESNSFTLTTPEGAEKGLILASNLPIYVKADQNTPINTKTGFNLHQTPSGTIVEEFSDKQLAVDGWTQANFYNRQTKDTSFACRINDSRLPSCSNGGDLWRPATVLGDSVTLLSSNFRFGFRNEGGYDQRNNMGNAQITNSVIDLDGSGVIDSPSFNETLVDLDLNGDGDKLDTSVQVDETNPPLSLVRRFNGFFDNDYVTSYNWVDIATGQPKDLDTVATGTQGSSYLNNYITPVQRRGQFSEYIMEICRRVPVSSCGPNDWFVGFDQNGNGTLEAAEKNIKAYQLGAELLTAGKADGDSSGKLENGEVNWATGFGTGTKSPLERLGAGTTARPALDPADQRYPRRVAFARNNANQLQPAAGPFQPLGVGCPLDATGATPANNGCTYATGAWAENTHYGTITNTNNALWFQTTTNIGARTPSYSAQRPLFYDQPINLLGQPLLVPVLQVHTLTSNPRKNTPNTFPFPSAADECIEVTNWLQKANTSGETFNLLVAGGDTPPRPSEQNGGLENYVRLLENWGQGSTCNAITTLTAQISGSFIQIKRSAYATAPFLHSLQIGTQLPSRFGYNLAGKGNTYDRLPYSSQSGGRNAFYTAPNRLWGYDVGLLSQLPDLFSQRFTTPPAGDPDEFFREVGQNDPWVQALINATPD